MDEPLFINKVEASGILTFDLYDFKPAEDAVLLDLKDFLYLGLILKEKEFKEALAAYDWEQLRGKAVAITCSEDSIIPTWAYMMLAHRLSGIAILYDYCSAEALDLKRWKIAVLQADITIYRGAKVVVRAYPAMDPALYLAATELLLPYVSTLLYGEAGLPKVIAKNG